MKADWEFFGRAVEGAQLSAWRLFNAAKPAFTYSTAKRLMKGVYPKRPSMKVVRALQGLGLLPRDDTGAGKSFAALYQEERIRKAAEGALLPAGVVEALVAGGAEAMQREQAMWNKCLGALALRLENDDAQKAYTAAREVDQLQQGNQHTAYLNRSVAQGFYGNTTTPGNLVEFGFSSFAKELREDVAEARRRKVGGRAGGRTSKKVGETARNSAGGSVAPAGRQSRSGKR